MNEVQSEGEFIKAPSEINRLLNKVKEKLSPVTIRLPGVSRSLTSYVLEVNAKKRFMVIDEILPKIDNRIMQEGRSFTIETYYDGCRLRAKDLQARLIKNSDNTTTYQVPFPAEVHYMQRRASYRAQVRRTLEINTRTMDINRKVVSGLLRDISAEGCQLQVYGDHAEDLRAHDNKPVPIKLYFPNGTTLVLKVEFRFVGYDEQGQFTKCGCQFAELDPHKEREISRVVTDLQRDYINFTKNGGRQEGVPPLFLPPEVDDDIDKMDNAESGSDGKAETAEKKVAKKVTQPVKLDYLQLHSAAIGAVKSLIGSIRLEQSLPLDELQEAAAGLYHGLLQDREQMLLMTHRRNTTDFIFEHPVGFAVLLVDQASVQQPGLISEDLCDLMLAGLCHDVPKALLPDGGKENTYVISADKLPALRKNILTVRQLLRAESRLPAIVSTIVSENYERMDGSGLPEGLPGDRLHPMGRLAGTLDLIDTAAHLYRDDVYYYPAMAYKRALSMPAQFDPQLVKRVVMNQGLYPLGATVKLSNGYLGLVMRQDNQRKPRIVRQVYNLKENSQTPPRDLDLHSAGVTVEGHGDPVKHSLGGTLLQSPLQL
ncbi:MAG: flagellar regulator YcgR PilZN domain-containing protein [Natronospirillum sp.]